MQAICYKTSPPPEDLSFDEASLYWRLRLEEGMPVHKWHKPSDRSKSWEEIRTSLEQKIKVCLNKKDSLFEPLQKALFRAKNSLIATFKAAFLFSD